MKLVSERYFVYLGLLFGIIPLTVLYKNYEINLDVLSIFFGGLLATVAIVQIAWDSNTVERLRKTGHDKYLLEYFMLPLYISFFLMVIQILKQMITLPISEIYLNYLQEGYAVITFALIGMMFLGTFRILYLVVPLIRKENG